MSNQFKPKLERPVFKGKNITRFLKDYENFCEYYGIEDEETKVKEAKLFISRKIEDYDEIHEEFEAAEGYIEKKWKLYKSSLRETFIDDDIKYSRKSLRKLKLKKDSNLKKHLRRFQAKVKNLNDELSDQQKCTYLYGSLTETYREIVKREFSDFDDCLYVDLIKHLKKLAKNAKWDRKLSESGYKDSDSDSSDSDDSSDDDDSSSSDDDDDRKSSKNKKTKKEKKDKKAKKENEKIEKPQKKDDVDKLTEELERLKLMYTNLTAEVNSVRTYTPRCIFCDSKEHARKKECPYLMSALAKGDVKFDKDGKIVDENDELIKPRWNRGGIMAELAERMLNKRQPVSNHITVESSVSLPTKYDCFVHVANGGVVDVTDNQNVSVYAKRLNEGDGSDDSSKRIRINDLLNNESEPMNVDQREETNGDVKEKAAGPRIVASVPGMTATSKIKSPLAKADDIETTVSEILDQEVKLSLRKLLSISPNIVKDLVEKVKPKRVTDFVTTETVPRTSNSTTRVTLNRIEVPIDFDSIPYDDNPPKNYIMKTPDVIGRICGVDVKIVIDQGSELNILSSRFYVSTNCQLPIDTKTVGNRLTFNTAVGSGSIIGVIHSCLVEIGGIRVEVPVFVSDTDSFDVLMARPYQSAVSMQTKEAKGGALYIQIRDSKTGRTVHFCGVQPDHPKTRSNLFFNSFKNSNNNNNVAVNRITLSDDSPVLKTSRFTTINRLLNCDDSSNPYTYSTFEESKVKHANIIPIEPGESHIAQIYLDPIKINNLTAFENVDPIYSNGTEFFVNAAKYKPVTKKVRPVALMGPY